MKTHASGRKHGVADDDIRQAAVVLVFESGNELVIHAMPARKQFLELLP